MMLNVNLAIQPAVTSCGSPCTVTVTVTWAGPATRRVEVSLTVPPPCQFVTASPIPMRKTGGSPLQFVFPGSFQCPPGRRSLLITADARDLDTGDANRDQAFVEVSC